MSRFTGKVAIVTGSSSGIGQAIAVKLASEGCSVVIDYMSHIEGAQDTQNKMAQSGDSGGGKSILVQCDVTKPAEVQNMVEQAYSQLGGCDILVNNAGVERHAPFLEATEADYDLVLDTNLKAAFFLTQRFCQKLAEAPPKKPGRVINISSVHEDMVFSELRQLLRGKRRHSHADA